MSRLKALLIAPLFLLVTACASVPTALLSPEALYPAAITSCADEPQVPARPAPGQPRPDEEKAAYTASLRGAFVDCKDTVSATAQRKADYVKQYDKATEPGWKKLVPHFGKKD